MTNTEMQLRNIITAIRAALGTPEDVDVLVWAAQVAADAAKWRREAIAMKSTRAIDFIADAGKWRTVPWRDIDGALLGWELQHDIDDEMVALRTWRERSKPEEVTTE